MTPVHGRPPLAQLLVVVCVVMAGCTTSKQYILKLHSTNPAAHQLCVREAEAVSYQGAEEEASPANCQAYANQGLDAPGTLSVQVTGIESGARYELAVEHIRHAPGVAQSGQILGTWMERLGRLTEQVVAPGLITPTGANQTLLAGEVNSAREQSEAKRNVFAAVIAAAEAKQLDQFAESGRSKLLETLLGNQPDTREPDADEIPLLYDAWVTEEDDTWRWTPKNIIDQLAADPSQQLLGTLNEPYPPARDHVISDAEWRWLEERQLADGLVYHVATWCRLNSFGIAFDGHSKWLEYVQNHPVTEAQLRDALGLTTASVAAVLLGNADALDIKARIDEATQAYDPDATDAGQSLSGGPLVVFQVRRMALIHESISNCQRNLEAILDRRGSRLRTRQRRDLLALNEELRQADKHTRGAAELFALLLEPFLVRQTLDLVEREATASALSFGTFTLKPGDMNIAVGKIAASGEQTTVADVELSVAPWRRFAVGVGPFLVMCLGRPCLGGPEEEVVPARTNGDGGETIPAKRQLVMNSSRTDLGAALSLHITLFSWQWLQTGPLIGYPIPNAGAFTDSALLGWSVRHNAGINLGVGAHLLRAQGLRDGYTTPIDLTLPENVGLTADDVAKSEVRVALFAFVGISLDVLRLLL